MSDVEAIATVVVFVCFVVSNYCSYQLGKSVERWNLKMKEASDE